jgi:hypothetical protein
VGMGVVASEGTLGGRAVAMGKRLSCKQDAGSFCFHFLSDLFQWNIIPVFLTVQ